jgi:hypothetical protein
LSKEPYDNAETFILPQGTKIVNPYGLSWHGGSVAKRMPLGLHIDMEDMEWLPIIDRKTLKVLGWIQEKDTPFYEYLKLGDPFSQDVFESEKLMKEYSLEIEYLF